MNVPESQSSVPVLKVVTQTLISSPAETRISSCKNVQQKWRYLSIPKNIGQSEQTLSNYRQVMLLVYVYTGLQFIHSFNSLVNAMKVLDIRIVSGVFLLMPLSQILYTIQILEYPIAVLLVLELLRIKLVLIQLLLYFLYKRQ